MTTMTKDQEIAYYVDAYMDGKAYVAMCLKHGIEADPFGMGDVFSKAKSAINYLLMDDATPAKPYPEGSGNWETDESDYRRWSDSVGDEAVEAFNEWYEAELNQMIDDAVTAYLAGK